MTATLWTDHTARCTYCSRLFRVSVDALAQARWDYDNFDGEGDDAALANGFDYCLACVTGDVVEGEHVDETGKAVRLSRNVERFPHFIAEQGRQGVITEWDRWQVVVKLDEPLAGAEEWDNCIIWTRGQDAPFWLDVRILGWPEDLPTCECCGRLVGDGDDLQWAPYCSATCEAKGPAQWALATLCYGAQDQDGTPLCDGPDVQTVYVRSVIENPGTLPFETQWCEHCRVEALNRGDVFLVPPTRWLTAGVAA
jgi:hypothetical protein